MSTRQRAAELFNVLTENELDMFIYLFGSKHNIPQKQELSEKQKAIACLKKLAETLPPLPVGFDEKAARDEYLKEKYCL